jgi:hypothetical protein
MIIGGGGERQQVLPQEAPAQRRDQGSGVGEQAPQPMPADCGEWQELTSFMGTKESGMATKKGKGPSLRLDPFPSVISEQGN